MLSFERKFRRIPFFWRGIERKPCLLHRRCSQFLISRSCLTYLHVSMISNDVLNSSPWEESLQSVRNRILLLKWILLERVAPQSSGSETVGWRHCKPAGELRCWCARDPQRWVPPDDGIASHRHGGVPFRVPRQHGMGIRCWSCQMASWWPKCSRGILAFSQCANRM